MSFDGETGYSKEAQWRLDIRRFLFAFAKHWETWVALVLSGGTASIFQWQGRITVIPGWALWLVAMSGIMVSAFKTWRDQKRIAESATSELEKLKSTHEKSIEVLRATLERKESEIDRLTSELIGLRDSNQTVAKHELARAILGELLMQLDLRIETILSLHVEEWYKTLTDEEDKESMTIIWKIRECLYKHFSPADAALFISKEGLRPSSRVDGLTTFHSHLNCRSNVVDHLKHWSAQLKSILQRL
jgi:hypothetical protein